MESTIRLFKALPISTKRKKNSVLLEETVKRGFIFSPEVSYNYSEKELRSLITSIDKELGLSAKEMNSSFHKSWKKVKKASVEQLVLEQVIHYITTYGFESLGIYNESSVYIPNEKLEIPELEENINLVVVRGYKKEELKEKLLKLVGLGVALHEDTIKDVVDVALFVDLTSEEVDEIKNKEVKASLYDQFDLVPTEPVEFLRYMVYKATGTTLLIKSSNLIEQIRENSNKPSIVKSFDLYDTEHGFALLSEIFYRFKPLFLAFRTNDSLRRSINKIRRLAVQNHKPMPEDFLNNVTAKISRGEKIKKQELEKELERVNTFRKIRLAYALKFRTKDSDSILYRIRNGKGFATDFEFKNKSQAKKVLDIIVDSIAQDISKNVKGKKFYIPDFINYSLPATEKQFTGYFPSGTYVSVPKDMVVGINWENIEHHRIDLDLSVISAESKTGWDAFYKSEDQTLLFSGDVTDASGKNGATELFYIQKQKKDTFIMLVNYYNYAPNLEVPFKILVAKEQVQNQSKNRTVDPNNVVVTAKSKITKKQNILGLIITTTNGSRFYFAETNIGKSITSGNNEYTDNARKYLLDFYQNSIDLKDILEKAGSKFVDSAEKSDVDLSPENLEKDTILNLLM